MPAWKVQVGRGWREGKIPLDVQKILEIHPDGQGKAAVLCINAHSELRGDVGGSDIPLYKDEPSDTERTTATLFQLIGTFLKHLKSGSPDVVSFIFVNFKPKTFSLSPRPEPFLRYAGSLEDGLIQFCEDVAGSITGSEHMWSTCEWAMLSLSA